MKFRTAKWGKVKFPSPLQRKILDTHWGKKTVSKMGGNEQGCLQSVVGVGNLAAQENLII